MVDERKKTPEKCAENSSPGFTFWGKLVNLPIVQTTVQVYGNIKQRNVVFGVGFKAFEMGVALASSPVKSMANSVSDTYPKQVSALNGLACTLVDTFQAKFPVVKEPTDKIIKQTKRGAENMLHAGVRRIFRTTPGCQALKGLDYMITWSEERLCNLSTPVCDTPLEPQSPEKVSDTSAQTSVPKTPPMKEKLASKSMRTAAFPLAVWVGVLKRVKRFLAGLMFGKHRTISCTASPRKHVDVSRRRKVSPKKRLQPRGILQKALHSMMGAVGISRADDDDVRLYLPGDQSDDQSLKDKTIKRKHEAVSGSEYETDEEYQLQELLENYNSEEDSDYVPSEHGSTDSLEYKDDESESESELLKERNDLAEEGKAELEKVEEEKGSPSKQKRRRRGRKNKKEKESAESKDVENAKAPGNEENPSQENAQGEQCAQGQQESGHGEDVCPPPPAHQEHHEHHQHHEHTYHEHHHDGN